MANVNGNNKKHGGVASRIGRKFYKHIEKIKDDRLLNGKSKERISTEKITNLIIRHNLWEEICTSITGASEKEVNQYGI